jgi:hypothetical protein
MADWSGANKGVWAASRPEAVRASHRREPGRTIGLRHTVMVAMTAEV